MATVRKLCEDALVAYLQAANIHHDDVTPAVLPGRYPGDKPEPCIVCTAHEWQEDEPFLNWYRVRCTVELKVHARTDPVDLFDELSDSIRAALRVDDLGAQLMAAQPGLVLPPQGISAADKGEFTIADDVWIATRELELYASVDS